MKLYIYKDGTGLISGSGTNTITAQDEGTLFVGANQFAMAPGVPTYLHGLEDGGTRVIFVSGDREYQIGTVSVRNGKIVHTPVYSDLSCRLLKRIETVEDLLQDLTERIDKLEHQFDTNSLNFIIKGE